MEEWKKKENLELIGNKIFYVICEEECFNLSSVDCIKEGQLQSNQEEADTRMLLRAQHASINFDNVT